MFSIRGYKKIIFSTMILLCDDSWSQAMSCTQLFPSNYITNTSGLKSVDWHNQQGWGVFEQKKIFTPKEISYIRNQLSKTEGLEFKVFHLKQNSIYQRAQKLFGDLIATKLSNFTQQALSLVEAQTQKPYRANIWLRYEGSPYRFEQGHYHRDNTLTFTRAEIGESSWIAPEGPGTKPSFTNNKTLVFTNQFHGGTMELDPRLLIIIFFDFSKEKKKWE